MRPLEGFSAVLYARVSTDDKDQTVDSQVREMEAWCIREGVEIVEVFRESRSAGDLNRPIWNQMIGRIVQGGVDILLAWSESRISRTTSDMMQIEKLLKTHRVKIRYVSSGVAPETPEGSLINHIGTWQAQQEREKLRINTRNGMLTRKLQGVHCGRPAALIFAHKAESDKARIGENTKIVTVESVMDYADSGMTAPKVAAAIGVNVSTLKRALTAEGLFEEFQNRAKGVTCKRVESLNIEVEK